MKSFLSSKLCDHLTLVVIAAILTTSAHAILDENQNGLSDVWEKQYNNNALFPPEFSPTTDPDQDGWNNLTESIAGTNPNNATPPHDILKPHIQPNPAQGFFHIDHPTILGKNYQLQGSPDLLSWLTISDATLAHEEQLNHVSAVSTTAGVPPERFFWRVNITDNDFDNDGLTDAEEIILQTNPYHNDTDNDGIHDKAELLRALDPLNPDTDGDRLYDGQEDILTTHPLNPDTDSDGIQDGDEIANGTNPLLADTDGDGLSDLTEKNLGTNPLLADTDGDGINDAQEIINGTSPLTNDTDLDGIPDNIDNTPLKNNVITNPDLAGITGTLLNGLTSLWDFENLQNITANGSTSLAYANLINASHPAVYYGPTVSNDGLISRSANYQTANHSLIAPPQVFSGKTNWSISFWYKITQGSIQNKTGTLNTVLWAYNNGNGSNNNDTTPEFQVHAYKALTAQDSQKLIISHYHNGTLQPDLVTLIPQNDPLDNDTWQHLTITKNSGIIKVYRNAAQLNQFTTSAASYTATSTGYFALGRLHQSTTADTALRGKLDRFTIHNRALSATEVTALVDIDSDKDGLFDRVETATKLWRDTNTNGLADPGETTFQNDPFRAQPNNRDTDGDGLTDIQEQTLGTQISHPDSDGDLIPDGWEVSHSLNPLNAADAQLDNDTGGSDGLSNLDEYRHNSDPKKRDTDDDGVLDGPEAKGPDGNLATDDGSNPNDASDNGTRPPASELLALKLGVGDRSGSHSEDYVLNVFQLQPDGSEKRLYTLRSGGFGQYTEQTRSFPKTHTYTFQIDWQGTNNNAQSPGSANAEGADFDYHLVIEPLNGNQSHILIDSYDPRTKTTDPTQPLRDPEDLNPADDDNDDIETFLETHEPKRVVLLRASILVDANRDGQFSKEDEGQITEQAPWRIWTNGDNDWGETGGTDIQGLGSGPNDKDLYNQYIDQERDLVDFFSMTLQIRQALSLLPKETHQYSISLDGVENIPYIRAVWVPIYPLNNSYGDCNRHLKDVDHARSVIKLQSHRVYNDGAGYTISDEMLTSLANGNGIILIEGCIATSKNIEVIIRNRELNQIALKLRLPIIVSDVEDMFRAKWLDENLAGGSQGGFPTEPVNYPDSLTNGKTFIFVNGYNVSGHQSRGWHSELFKRMYQSGSRARFLGVIWHGNESQFSVSRNSHVTPDFWRNVHNAFRTSKSLADLVNEIPAVNGKPNEKIISAFSLGNVMTSSAIHDWGMQVSKYFLIDAAVPREAYSGVITAEEEQNMRNPEWAAYDKRLWASNWWQTFPENHACRDKVKWTGRFSAFPNAYNFYSSGEEVLKHSEGTMPPIDTSGLRAWTKQEMTKGFGFLSGGGIGHIGASGGWDWNPAWYITEFSGIENYQRKRNNAETQSISNEQLRNQPFFEPFRFDDFHKTETQEAAAKNYDEVSRLLAESIPAISYAVGSTPVEEFPEGHNFDMNTEFKNGWPATRNDDTGWHHSDIREMSYLYIYKLFDKFCELGELRNP